MQHTHSREADLGNMELQDDIIKHQRGHLDEVSLKPTEYVKRKTLLKYKAICAVSRCCSSGLLV